MPSSDPWFAEEQIPCRDPECPGLMEPEADADHRYWACTTCGYEAGYEKAQSSTACATGQVQNFDTPVPVAVPLGMPGRRPDQ